MTVPEVLTLVYEHHMIIAREVAEGLAGLSGFEIAPVKSPRRPPHENYVWLTRSVMGEPSVPVKNPELLPLFEDLRALLQAHSRGLVVQEPEPRRYELWSTANIAPAGRPEHKPYFAGLIVQKSYGGLYYTLIYSDPEISSQLSVGLMATLGGKSCFHIKARSPQLREHIDEALRLGYDLYRPKNWL